MRYLAIDPGDKRTGLATGDDESGFVAPVDVIVHPPGDALIDALVAAIEEHGAEAIVIGLPLNMDGTAGPAAKKARALGEALAARTELPVIEQDERLTSFAADQAMARSGRTHKQKKQLRDALAAAAILRDYLGARDREREP